MLAELLAVVHRQAAVLQNEVLDFLGVHAPPQVQQGQIRPLQGADDDVRGPGAQLPLHVRVVVPDDRQQAGEPVLAVGVARPGGLQAQHVVLRSVHAPGPVVVGLPELVVRDDDMGVDQGGKVEGLGRGGEGDHHIAVRAAADHRRRNEAPSRQHEVLVDLVAHHQNAVAAADGKQAVQLVLRPHPARGVVGGTLDGWRETSHAYCKRL